MTRPQPEPVQLNPALPPGRSDRKALRYVREVHRLRAEGHTLESIRQALLDAGVSVSLSTVRREAARPASKWELRHAQEVPLALVPLPPARAASDMTLSPRPLDASGGQPDARADAEHGLAAIEVAGDRGHVGLVFKVFAFLRQCCRAARLP